MQTHRRRAPSGDGHAIPPDVARHVELWVGASLITREQAEAIRSFEEATPEPARGVPLVTEALGYLGTALAGAAGLMLLLQNWNDIPSWIRVSLLGLATVLLFGAGWAIRSRTEPAMDRLAAVLWLLSVASGAWFLWVLAHDVLLVPDAYVSLIAGVAATVYAAALFLVRPRSLQQLALFGSIVFAMAGLTLLADRRWGLSGEEAAMWFGAIAWILGAVWLVLAWRGRVRPEGTALVIGSIAVFLGPNFVTFRLMGLGLLLAIATSAGLMAASVWTRRLVLLGFGAVGLFWYLFRAIQYYLSETIGLPLGLLLGGVGLLAIALLTARLRPLTRSR